MELKVVPEVKVFKADAVGKVFTQSASQTISVVGQRLDGLLDLLQEDLQSTCPSMMEMMKISSSSKSTCPFMMKINGV